MAKPTRSETPQLSILDLPAKGKAPVPPAAAKPVDPPPEPKREPSPAHSDEKPARRATAETMAQKQREISISEFFTKNRHLLGFDNPSKALLTTVKEAVDNSLDACEEAGILPDVEVEITELGGDRFKVSVEDNGPGIVKAQIPKVFGKLLYGSKFHRLISAAVMYGQLTTGKPARVLSRIGKGKDAHEFFIRIDTRTNAPDSTEKVVAWNKPSTQLGAAIEKEHGTRVEIEMTANFVNGQRSLLRYLEQTALANPHATVRYLRPRQPVLEFPRSTNDLPIEAVEIMPHPHGTELGMLMQKLVDTDEKTLTSFLQKSFSRILPKAAEEICATAKVGVRAKPAELTQPQIEALHKAMLESKIPAPPTTCLSPIGDALMRKGLVTFLNVIEEEGGDVEEMAREAQLAFPTRKAAAKQAKLAEAPKAEAPAAAEPVQGELIPAPAPLEEGEEEIKGHRYFISTVTRPPKVYRGNPFQVEVGLAYGGSRPSDQPIELYRMANRVPLLFQRSACGVTDAVVKTPWRNYEISQSKGALPNAPMVLLVHIASVWVPFTSESKEAIAHYPEILAEIKLALQDVGRKLAAHLRKKKRADSESKRRNLFLLYIEEIAEALHKLTGRSKDEIKAQFMEMALEVTADADFEKQLLEAAAAAREPAPKKKSKDEDE
jgi:DNA topoisomerase-6 subunit B